MTQLLEKNAENLLAENLLHFHVFLIKIISSKVNNLISHEHEVHFRDLQCGKIMNNLRRDFIAIK